MRNSTPKRIVQSIVKSIIALIIIGSSQSISAQTTCDHLVLDYNVNQSYFALGINNTKLEEAKWIIEIFDAHYKLDASEFSNSIGITLTIETTENINGTYHHLITPDQTIAGYQYLNFVYNGMPPSTNNNYKAETEIHCKFAYGILCANLEFNFFNEAQYSFGFSIQNNNSVGYYPYEIYIDDANYNLDTAQLHYTGFDFFATDNGNGTYDYFFLAQDTVAAYSSSPTVKTNQDLGPGVRSLGATIQCDTNIVSSGLNGGLESHGALATKIALRNFRRAIGRNTAPVATRDNSIIEQLAPRNILNGDELIESSPNDLIPITKAETIWAGDYYVNGDRHASIFGSKTSEEVYDHTKVICDRVKGSELAAVELVNIGGYETILSVIRRPNKTIEYAISFSLAYENFGEFTLASYWALDEYPHSSNFLNYQVWTNSKAKSIAAVQQIITNVITEKGYNLYKAKVAPQVPKLFARTAYYKLGAFYIELHNQLSEATTVQFSGTCTSKEINGEVLPIDEEIEVIPGQTSIQLEVPYGNIFDGEITLRTANEQKDVVYLADGSWGLDYEDYSTTVENYEIIADERTEDDGAYLVERGISVSGSTDTYVSIFKQLIPGGLPVDLSDYNTLSFDSQRKGVFEITLLMSGNTDPSQNLSYTLATEAGASVDIPFVFFSNANGAQLDPTQITTIYIAFTNDNNERKDFDFSIENIRFRNAEESNLEVDPNRLNLYPNPTNGIVNVTHNFSAKTEVRITISDTKGTVFQSVNTTAYKGLQNFGLNLENYETGIYLISLFTNEESFANTLLYMK